VDQIFLGNPLSAWLQAAITFIAVFLVIEILVYISKKLSKKNDKPLLLITLISQLKWFSCIILPLWAASAFLTIPVELTSVFRVILIATLAIQTGAWLDAFIKLISNRELDRTPEEDLSKRSSIRGIAIAARVLVWIILILIILESIPNFNIVSVITSLGLGGIAIGLAAQSFVKDILSSLTIHLDKPFDIGDSIKSGDFSGTVEKIGLGSTTIRSVNGEAVRISNSKLLDSPLQNYNRMEDRFQSFSIPLSPGTHPDKIRVLPALVEDALNKIDNVEFNRCRLKGFNPASLDLEIAYTVTTPQFSDYITASHAVNLAIMDLLDQQDIQTASPTVIPT